MSLEDDYRAVKRLLDTVNEANLALQEKNRELMEENSLLLKKLLHCQEALDINKDIMRNALTAQNEMKDSFTIEIQELRDKLKLRDNK